jgi:hypothetical protein
MTYKQPIMLNGGEAEWEVKLFSSPEVRRVVNPHPYGMGWANEEWTDVLIDAEILVPKAWGLLTIAETLRDEVTIDVDGVRVRPNEDTAQVLEVRGDQVVLIADWRLA